MSSNWQILPFVHQFSILTNSWKNFDSEQILDYLSLVTATKHKQTGIDRQFDNVLAYTPLTTREWTQHIQTSISSSCPPLGPVPFPCSLPYMTSQPSSTTSPLDSLPITEIFWRDNFTWFKDQGYQLRPRFAPDWIPSWLGTSKFRLQCEDGHDLVVSFWEIRLAIF